MSTTAASPYRPNAPLPFQLRPLTTGEVLDRSLSLYRTNFWFCMGITLISALLSLVIGLVRVFYIHFRHLSPATTSYNSPFLLGLLVVSSVMVSLAHGFVSAGTHWGIGSVYLGRSITLGAAIRVIRPHWLRYGLLTLVQLVSAAWTSLLLYGAMFAALYATRGQSPAATGLIIGSIGLLAAVSLPYSIYRYIRISVAIPASVMEGLGIRDALRRSKSLLAERKRRIFVLLLLLGALYLVIGSAIGILTLFALRGSIALMLTQLATLLTTFVATLLLQPYFTIAICLFYYDERVRREGFDIEFMLASAATAPMSSEAGDR